MLPLAELSAGRGDDGERNSAEPVAVPWDRLSWVDGSGAGAGLCLGRVQIVYLLAPAGVARARNGEGAAPTRGGADQSRCVRGGAQDRLQPRPVSGGRP